MDTSSVGYLGMSMGTRFGLPFAAVMGSRLRCVVFGKFGVVQGPGLHEGLAASERIARDARQVTAPVMFHIQWDDEVFPRDGQLLGYAGTHAETKPAAIALWRDFIASHLVPGV